MKKTLLSKLYPEKKKQLGITKLGYQILLEKHSINTYSCLFFLILSNWEKRL
jgi:hypothetical protein